jgi:DNA methylase
MSGAADNPLLIQGDARRLPLPGGSVHCVVTSPPYWGLRKYEGVEASVWGGEVGCRHEWGDEIPGDPRGGSGPNAKECYGGQDGKHNYARKVPRGAFCRLCGAWRGELGLEPTPDLYVAHLLEAFREVRRVLRDDGVAWLNLGDTHASGKGSYFNPGGGPASATRDSQDKRRIRVLHRGNKSDLEVVGLKPKDLCMIPARVTLARDRIGKGLRPGTYRPADGDGETAPLFREAGA